MPSNPTYGDRVGIIHVDIDDGLHRNAKSLAADRDEPLKALVTRAIEREVDRLNAERERRWKRIRET
jgi:hypothetical protein